ncbi:MAG: HAD family hydrolase [Defluviitaleaceae bacterium]|nr:HAD family hydrolase [Defluviitaleaceae bacterium]
MKTQIKMIVTDLDGTLLRSDKTVSERTMKTLAHCREQGIKIIFATGRTASSLSLAPMHLFDGYATANGAIAKIGDMLIYKSLIPSLEARKLLVACHKRGLPMSSQYGGYDHSNFIMSDVWPEVTLFEIVDFSTHDKDAEKIITYNLNPDDIEFINKHLPNDSYMVMALDGLAMITHKDATKSKAVAAVAAHWGIKKEEIVAFGDDLNDIDMLEYVGTGVVMGNGLDAVKAVADDSCPSNDNDGVACWIETNIIIKTQKGQPLLR